MIEATTSATPSIGVLSWSRRQLRAFGALMLVANLAVPCAMLIEAAITGEAYWRMFRGEEHAADWFSSLQLVIIALVAYGNYRLCAVSRRLGLDEAPRLASVWALVALGCLLLALDERFDIHEALRDDLFRPTGLLTDVHWLVPGDVGLYLFVLLGVLLAAFLLEELRRAPPALALLAVALALALPAVVIDSLADSAMASWPLRRFFDYTFEETAEIWAELMVLLAFLRTLACRLERLERLEAAAP